MPGVRGQWRFCFSKKVQACIASFVKILSARHSVLPNELQRMRDESKNVTVWEEDWLSPWRMAYYVGVDKLSIKVFVVWLGYINNLYKKDKILSKGVGMSTGAIIATYNQCKKMYCYQNLKSIPLQISRVPLLSTRFAIKMKTSVRCKFVVSLPRVRWSSFWVKLSIFERSILCFSLRIWESPFTVLFRAISRI